MAILSKKQTCPLGCVITKWTVCALLVVVSVAALVGVFQTHIIDLAPLRVQFGSTGGSFSILAFAIAITSSMKQLVCCMGKCDVCSK